MGNEKLFHTLLVSSFLLSHPATFLHLNVSQASASGGVGWGGVRTEAADSHMK